MIERSLREKKRYIKFQGSRQEVEKTILEFLGILGWAKASPMFVKKNILAINRKELDKVRAAFLFGKIKILKVSGTLRGLG